MREGAITDFSAALVQSHPAIQSGGLVGAVAEDAADAEGAVPDFVRADPMAAIIGPPGIVETYAGKARRIEKVVAGREDGGDLRINVAQGRLEAPHVAVLGRPADVLKTDLHRAHPASHGVPRHAAVAHARRPGLMRLTDERQIAIGPAHSARVADDAIDRPLGSALGVAGVDEQLEDIVGEQVGRRVRGVGPRLASEGIGHADHEAEFLGIVGDFQVHEVPVAGVTDRADGRIDKAGETAQVARVGLDIDGLAAQGGDAVGRAGHGHEGDRVGRHAAAEIGQGRDRHRRRRGRKQGRREGEQGEEEEKRLRHVSDDAFSREAAACN